MVQATNALHNFVSYATKSLAHKTIEDIECNNLDKASFSLHMIAASYVADIPESKDSLSVKKGGLPTIPWHIRELRIEEICSYLGSLRSWWSKTKAMIHRISKGNSSKTQANQQLNQILILYFETFLVLFLFNKIFRCANVYSIIHFERIHNILLKVNRLL